jgi:hypothetical protein
MSSEGFSALEKNSVYMFSEGNATQAVRCDRPLADSNGNLAHLVKMWTCWVPCGSLLLTIIAVWRSSKFKKYAPYRHYYLQRAVTPDQITQQNSLQRAGGP